MEVEVVAPAPPVDFNFDSNCSSPYMTAPSSPQRFGNLFFSAPTSPSRISTLREQSDLSTSTATTKHSFSAASVPFDWEERPGIPKRKSNSQANDVENEGFEFDFSGQLEQVALSAEELFDGGKIRPLKPPPKLQSSDHQGLSPPASNASSPRSKLSQGKRIFQEALSPRHQKKDFDPFVGAIEGTGKQQMSVNHQKHLSLNFEEKRGRDTAWSSLTPSSSGSRRKGSRSLSPLRVSEIARTETNRDNSQRDKALPSPTSNSKATNPPSPSSPSRHSSFLSSLSYKTWKLKDLLLFRSASEGRADSKDPLRKYTVLSKKTMEEDVKNFSFRSTESSSGSVSRRRGTISPHELHYTVNRAVSEEMKKKTFLPYKQGLLGCLGFHPGMHEISRGIGSSTRV